MSFLSVFILKSGQWHENLRSNYSWNTHTLTHTHTHRHTHTHTHTGTHTLTDTHRHTDSDTQSDTQWHTHTFTQTYTHTHTDTHKRARVHLHVQSNTALLDNDYPRFLKKNSKMSKLTIPRILRKILNQKSISFALSELSTPLTYFAIHILWITKLLYFSKYKFFRMKFRISSKFQFRKI